MYKKILVPLDGSEFAEAVLPHAEALAKSEGAEIVLLRVVVTPNEGLFSRNSELATNIIEEMEDETDAYIKAEVTKLKNEGVKVFGLTRDGPLPDTILAVAEETSADVIAMSTHGRTGVQRWLLGSVADKIVHNTHIPVMLIHPNLN